MSLSRIFKIILHNWSLIFILLLAFFLRVWRINELFYFTYDESIPAFVGRRLILWHHLPLIGGATPFGFHLGPYFYWFYSLLLFFGKSDPIVWGWAGAVIAMITTLMIYLVGRSFFSKKVGVTAAILWASSLLANLFDRHLWALYWGPVISLLVLFSLYKIIKGEKLFVYILGLAIALAIHADPSNLVFLVLSALVWVIYKIPIDKRVIISFLFIPVFFLPLVIFDFRHDFANTRPILSFIKQGRNNPSFDKSKFIDNSLLFPRSFSRLIYKFGGGEVSKEYSYCKNFVIEKFKAIPTLVILISSLILASFVFWGIGKNRKDPGIRIISLLVILYFLGIQIYGTIFRADIFEHYITGLFPVFVIIAAFLIGKFPRGLWLFALAVFVAVNIYKLSATVDSIGYENKKAAIKFTMEEVGDKSFSLDSLSTCWKYSGYRYLFAVFGREPVKSYVDPNFAYLYGTTPVSNNHPSTVVSFVIHDFQSEKEDFYKRYAVLKSHEMKSSLFGNIEVIILNNSSTWFDQPVVLKDPNLPLSKD